MEFPILKASSRITARLNYLCPQFFPAPGFWSPQHVNNNSVNPASLRKGCKCFSDILLLSLILGLFSDSSCVLFFACQCVGSSPDENISAENLLKVLKFLVLGVPFLCFLDIKLALFGS